MKAAIYEQYGAPEVIQLREIEKPVPGRRQLLIKVHATTVNSADCRLRSLNVPRGFGPFVRLALGLRRPRQPILGSELSGVVEAVGQDVKRFHVGDPVIGFVDTAMGAHAEYTCISEDAALERKPDDMSFEHAAALSFGGTTALHFLRKAKIKQSDRVLVNGASGSVGTACVQLARHFGAEVTAVCSGANVELVRSLGAAHVIDYTREDFTRNGQTYDLIVDNVGTAPFSRCRDSLAPRGRLLLVCATLFDTIATLWMPLLTRRRVIAGVSLAQPEMLRELIRLAQAGAYRPVLDRPFAFEQIVDAHRYVDAGHKRGSVVLVNLQTVGDRQLDAS